MRTVRCNVQVVENRYPAELEQEGEEATEVQEIPPLCEYGGERQRRLQEHVC